MRVQHELLIRVLDRVHRSNSAFFGHWCQLKRDMHAYMYMGWGSRSADPYDDATFEDLIKNDPERVLVQAFTLKRLDDTWILVINPQWTDCQWDLVVNNWNSMTNLQDAFEKQVYIEQETRIFDSGSTLIAQGHDNYVRAPTCSWIQVPKFEKEQYENTINYLTNGTQKDHLSSVWDWIMPYVHSHKRAISDDEFYLRLIEAMLSMKQNTTLYLLHACIHSASTMQALRPWFCKEMLQRPELFHEIESDDILVKALKYHTNTPIHEQLDDIQSWIVIMRNDRLLNKLSFPYTQQWMIDVESGAERNNVKHPLLDQYRAILALSKSSKDAFSLFRDSIGNSIEASIELPEDLLLK